MSGAQFMQAQPVINSIYPPTLTERVGDHVAFTVSATGSGPLAYQWYQNGSLLANQTNAWIVLTNIQTTNSGQYGVTVTDVSNNYASNSATLNVSGSYLPVYPTNLVVLRLGDGVQTLSGATGNTIYLDQYTTNGTYVSTIQIPDNLPGQPYGVGTNKTISASPAVILPGAGSDAVNQGVLTLSGNQQFITFGGYQLAYPFTSTDVTAGGATFVRGIYTINAYGYPSLAYTNYGLYSAGNHTFRSATTSDGTNFWTTGQAGSNGIKYVNATNTAYANGNNVPVVSSSGTGDRVVQIFNGNLIFSDTNTAGNGLWVYGGLPEPASGGTASGAVLLLNEGGRPNDFAVSPDSNTVYIADSRSFTNNVQSGGIQRWDFNGRGYSYSYTLAPTTGTNGAQNLAVYFPTNISAWGAGVTGAVIYATLAVVTNNSIVSIIDDGSASAATTLVTAGPNQVLRGLRFGPPAVAGLSIANQPQSQTAAIGNNPTLTVVAQGAPPFFYQWQFNGTNISGATLSSLTLTNVQLTDAGNYSVIVSNPATFTISSNALLTVVQGAPVITAEPQSWVETAGDHLAFSVQITGSQPINYQWFSNSEPVLGATNSALIFTNIQTGNAGTYYVIATNAYGFTNSIRVTLTVTTNLQFLYSSNLVVARVGDGSQTLSGATGNTIYLDQYTTDGTYVSSIQVPDQGAGLPYGYGAGTNVSSSANLPFGSDPLIVAGAGNDAPYEALLTLSADNASINFAGYVEAYPNNTSDVTYPGPQTSAGNSTNNWRGIAGVSAYGYYSFIYTNSGLYSGGNHAIHSAGTLEGVNFWSAGLAQNDGIKYFNTQDSSYANGAGIPQVVSSGPGTRIVQLLKGNVAFTDASASPPGIYTILGGGASGLQKGGLAPSSLFLNEGGSPVDFAVSPDGQTIYISDDRAFGGSNVQLGGIQRWDSDGEGGFNYNYTLATGTNSVGATGLTAYFPPSISAWGTGVTGAVLYATTAERPNNRLISIVDNGAGSVATTLSTSGANQAFAGIRFGPSIVPVGLYNNPQTTNILIGQSVTLYVAATGSAPYYYQWQLNGTNIEDATNATLTLNNAQTNNDGSYTVIVSNNVSGPISSSAGQLTVLALPQFTSASNLGSGQGFQLNFNGPAGFNYSIWTSTNLTLRPVKSTWINLITNGVFSGENDTYTDPNGGTNANQFYIITVP